MATSSVWKPLVAVGIGIALYAAGMTLAGTAVAAVAFVAAAPLIFVGWGWLLAEITGSSRLILVGLAVLAIYVLVHPLVASISDVQMSNLTHIAYTTATIIVVGVGFRLALAALTRNIGAPA